MSACGLSGFPFLASDLAAIAKWSQSIARFGWTTTVEPFDPMTMTALSRYSSPCRAGRSHLSLSGGPRRKARWIPRWQRYAARWTAL